MESYKKLLLANKAWAREKAETKADYFVQLAKDQKPDYLWIGCSDSRVPAEEITGVQPGEVFVHRNIANLVVHADFNLLSVLQYAVEHLKVPNIIVCGHYGCGGVRAAISKQHLGSLNKWLYYIKTNYSAHEEELKALDEETRLTRMVELNVIEQVKNLSRMALVQKSWRSTGGPTLHGWVFGLKDGLIRDLVKMGPDSPIDDIYRFDLEK